MPDQFDIFANPDPKTADTHPYLAVLQSNQLRDLNTRIVAPLVPSKAIPGFDRVTPSISIGAKRYVMDVTNLGVVPTEILKRSIGNVETERYRIIAALDLVFTGI